MKTLRHISSRINDVFIQAVLVVFYFLAIGAAFILHTLTRSTPGGDTFWTESAKTDVNLPSPY